MYRSTFSKLLGGFAATAAIFVAASMAAAVSYYWDTNGTTAGIGSATTPVSWLTNSWATGSTGLLATSAWPNTQPANSDEAVFMGTAGTVNIGADVYSNALRFTTNNYTIASTGGSLRLAGTDPKITVNLASNQQVVTISAPITSTGGFTVTGNSGATLKFLVLANASGNNSFVGPLTIDATGALRLGGGVAAEQIPDNDDMNVTGVVDFITTGGASDGKQEKVRNVTVSGASANFSIGNGANFVVNTITGDNDSGPGIALNGNSATNPARLSITGWSGGSGDLVLNNGRVRLNTTSATSAIGSRVVLSGNIQSSGTSSVTNVNGGGANINTNTFTNRAFDFAGTAHEVNVADGTLTFTSASPNNPLEITTTQPGGATVTKTGAGVWFLENAVQTSFTGTTRIQDGTLRLGASERLANGAGLQVTGGTLDLQSFDETVLGVYMSGGSITGTGTLTSSGGVILDSGSVAARLAGSTNLSKESIGMVQLSGANTYTGDTHVDAGTLSISNAYLANSSDVYLAAGATFDLNFVGSDTIDSLFINGVSQAAGTWGAAGSGAAHISNLFTGTGLLQVTTFIPLTGDYNGNSVVDAADFTVWRDSLGQSGAGLPADGDHNNQITTNDYDVWRAHFGEGSPGVGSIASVPEPSTALLGWLVLIAGRLFNRRPRQIST